MTPLRWQLERWRQAIGWPGVAGLGLLLLALVIYAVFAIPERLRIEAAQQQLEAARARASAAPPVDNQSPEARLAAFYREFPGRETVSGWLEKIYAAGTESALDLDRADYRLSADRNSHLLRYEITLPASGTYVQIRQFIQTVLERIPTLALADLQLKRGDISEPKLEVQIRFVLYLRESA